MGGDKERKGASIREEADLVDRSDDAVDLQRHELYCHIKYREQRLTVSPLKGLQTTARYPTVNWAKPLPGRIRPSDRVKVSMIVTM